MKNKTKNYKKNKTKQKKDSIKFVDGWMKSQHNEANREIYKKPS